MTSNCECECLKIPLYVAISSQASEQSVEGSTTNVYFRSSLGYNEYPTTEIEYETTRVRDYRERVKNRISQRMAKEESRKAKSPAAKGVSKLQSKAKGIRSSISQGQSTIDKRSTVELDERESGIYKSEEERKVCSGQHVQGRLTSKELSASQKATTEYTFLYLSRRFETILRGSNIINRFNGNTILSRPHNSLTGKICKWTDCTLKSTSDNAFREFKEEQLGRRYSLSLVRKAKKQCLNGIAVTQLEQDLGYFKDSFAFYRHGRLKYC